MPMQPHNETAALLHHLHNDDTELPMSPLPDDAHMKLEFLEASIAWREIRSQWQEEMRLLAVCETELAKLRYEVEQALGPEAVRGQAFVPQPVESQTLSNHAEQVGAPVVPDYANTVVLQRQPGRTETGSPDLFVMSRSG